MTRSKKIPKLTAAELTAEMRSVTAVQEVHSVSANAKKGRCRPRKATAEDDHVSDDGHGVLTLRGRHAKRRKFGDNVTAVKNVLDGVANLLKPLQDLNLPENWVEELTPEGKRDIRSLQSRNIALLTRLSLSSDLEAACCQDAEASGSFNDFYTLRLRGGVIKLSATVDQFQAIPSLYTTRKTFGAIRLKGEFNPLMYTLPGWITGATEHPRFLESEMIKDLVMKFGEFHNYKFKKFVWDNHHGQKDGTTFASHCEPKLLIWFACHIVQKFMGQVKPLDESVGDLWLLRDMEPKVGAEIILSETPCLECKHFIQFYEKYMKIKVGIVIAPNIGVMVAQRNKHGYKDYRLGEEAVFDLETAEEEGDSDFVTPLSKSPRKRKAQVSRSKKITMRRRVIEEFRIVEDSEIIKNQSVSVVVPPSRSGSSKQAPLLARPARSASMSSEAPPPFATLAASLRTSNQTAPPTSSNKKQKPPRFASQLAQFHYKSSKSSPDKLKALARTADNTIIDLSSLTTSSDEEDWTPTRTLPKAPRSSIFQSDKHNQSTREQQHEHYSFPLGQLSKSSTPTKRSTRSTAPLTPEKSPYSGNIFAFEEAKKKFNAARREEKKKLRAAALEKARLDGA